MALVDTIIAPVVAIINKLIPDKTAAAAATAQLQQMAMNGQLNDEMEQLKAVTSAQSDIDKIEASNASKFVSGWRPFVGWICGFGLAYAAIIDPVIRFVAQVMFKYAGGFPAIDTTITMQVLFGMLGLGVYRTAEKIKGVAAK